jgi:LysM repeat protein
MSLKIKQLLLAAGLAALLCLALLTGVFAPGRVQAAPPGQAAIFTPTPGPDGKIIYIVKKGDTLISISLIMGVPLDRLRALNNITGTTINEGQRMVLGLAGPAEVTPTEGPTPTPTPVLPTSTAQPGFGKLCVVLFEDQNGDSIRQQNEPSIPDGALSVNNRSGSFSKTAKTTANPDDGCFTNIPEGDFTLSVAIPAGYNPTTENSYNLSIKPGDITYVDFGAQKNSLAQGEPIPAAGGGEPQGAAAVSRSPLLGILGGLLLLAGIVLAVFAGRLLKK